MYSIRYFAVVRLLSGLSQNPINLFWLSLLAKCLMGFYVDVLNPLYEDLSSFYL
jgi:hypothetical protein